MAGELTIVLPSYEQGIDAYRFVMTAYRTHGAVLAEGADL
jgi:hypothetical protein